jgi:hypothetical protein
VAETTIVRSVIRTQLPLFPGQNGTKRLVEQYGDHLVCVRYRYDAEKRRRNKTVDSMIRWPPFSMMKRTLPAKCVSWSSVIRSPVACW